MKGLCSSVFRGIYVFLVQLTTGCWKLTWMWNSSHYTHLLIFQYIVFFWGLCSQPVQIQWWSGNGSLSYLTGITWPGFCWLLWAMCIPRSTPAMLGLSLLKRHLYFKVELHNKREWDLLHVSYSTETAHVFVIPQATSLSCYAVTVFTWTAAMP